MSKKIILFLVMCLSGILSVDGVELLQQKMEVEKTPKYLYKVLSVEDWEESQGMKSVKLAAADRDFIHFSTEKQLNRIIEKYWSNIPEYVVLKIETVKIPGKLVFETNPGGESKYYHLYSGSIPISAVVESKTIKK